MRFNSLRKYVFCTALSVLLFTAAWAYLASHMPSWSDEIFHISTAKGLLISGQPRVWSFDEGHLTEEIYKRGLLFTYCVKIAFKTWGVSLLVARLPAYLFILATFFSFVFYHLFRCKGSLREITYGALFFFFQSLVLEHANYSRIYAPLGFMTLVALIFLWEGHAFFIRQKKILAVLFFATSLAVLSIPTLDGWHFAHLFIWAVGLVSFFFWRTPLPTLAMGWVQRHRKLSLVLVALFVAALPLIVKVEGHIMGRLPVGIGGRMVGSLFKTYFDNICGIVRVTWALNVAGALYLWAFYKKQIKSQSFQNWLCGVGLFTAYGLAVFGYSNLSFYSRYYYASVALVCLGLSGPFLKTVKSTRERYSFVGAYIILNILLSVTDLYFDRSNIIKPIAWLNENIKESDVLVSFISNAGINGGENLVKQIITVLPTRAPEDVKTLISRLSQAPGNNVYFLYDYHYQFRERIEAAFGRLPRVLPTNDLYRYIRDAVPNEGPVLLGLRNCGLVRYKKDALIESLRRYIGILETH